jgi:hypothetical protein
LGRQAALHHAAVGKGTPIRPDPAPGELAAFTAELVESKILVTH